MNAKETIGFKQNNPLNIRPLPTTQWHGQTGSANGFCVFSEPRWCFRAWLINYYSYISVWDCKTVREFISHYAPPEDNNDTEMYVQTVAREMKIGPGEAFDFEARKLDFCKAQMNVEIGGNPYDDIDTVIKEGFSWAGNR